MTEEQNDISYCFTLLCTNTSITELGVTLMSKLKQKRVQNNLTEQNAKNGPLLPYQKQTEAETD